MRLATRRIYSGRVINLDLETVRYPDGSSGELEMIRHPGAAAVVPVLSDWDGADPVILLLRQFRHAAGGTLWEIPAGRSMSSTVSAMSPRWSRATPRPRRCVTSAR